MKRWHDRLQVMFVALLLGAGTWFWWQKTPSADEENALAVRSILAAQLHKMVQNPTLLAWAARFPGEGNQELAACLDLAGTCRITDPTAQMGFVMPTDLDPESLHYSGPMERPAAFAMTEAKPCRDCQGWLASTTFWAECPAGTVTCRQAKAVHVRVLVAPHPKAPWQAMPASVPPFVDYKQRPERFAMRVDIQQGI